VREAREGRAGLPVNDRVLETFPVREGIGEVLEEGGDGRGAKVFACFSSSAFGCLFSEPYQLFVGCRGFRDVVSLFDGKGVGGRGR
jgi:hypothetical protein